MKTSQEVFDKFKRMAEFRGVTAKQVAEALGGVSVEHVRAVLMAATRTPAVKRNGDHFFLMPRRSKR